jgi:hypothetical protein
MTNQQSKSTSTTPRIRDKNDRNLRNQSKAHEIYQRNERQRDAQLQRLVGVEERSESLELVTGHFGSDGVVATEDSTLVVGELEDTVCQRIRKILKRAHTPFLPNSLAKQDFHQTSGKVHQLSAFHLEEHAVHDELGATNDAAQIERLDGLAVVGK